MNENTMTSVFRNFSLLVGLAAAWGCSAAHSAPPPSLFSGVMVVEDPIGSGNPDGHGAGWSHDVLRPVLEQQHDLVSQSQNPISNLISLPFQFNFNNQLGPEDGNQVTMVVIPVLPFELNDEWNLITRTTIPVISNPKFTPGGSRSTGLGNTTFQLFFSPKEPTQSGVIWGVGPAINIPTNTGEARGPDRWGIGPTAVALKIDKPWVYGAVAQHIWSVSGGQDDHINQSLIQPFVNYNLEGGRYIVTSPIITADWEKKGSDTWTVPLGGGVGKIGKIGNQHFDASLQLFFNVVRPDDANKWNLRFQFKLLYPQKPKGG